MQNNLLPSGEKERRSNTLVIQSVDRHEAGTYVCEAHNGVGNQRATAHIRLQVLCEYDLLFWVFKALPRHNLVYHLVLPWLA